MQVIFLNTGVLTQNLKMQLSSFVELQMKRTAGIIFRSAFLIILGIVLGFLLEDNLNSRNIGLIPGSDKVSQVLGLVKNNYVDSVNTDSLEGVAINNLLQNLDPHSLYLPSQQAQSINERLEGGFTGIGLEYILLRDTLVITQTYPNGPAAAARLTPGDKITDINKIKFSGTLLTVKKVDRILKGEKDSKILLTAVLPGTTARKNFEVKRGHVDLSSLDAAYMAAPGIGYIKISKFALTTDADFRVALKKLLAKGMKKLILDLRDNGGGYLNAATALADEFLTKERLIVYTKGVHEERKDYFATDSGMFQDGKLAVIINEYSASASEILAGALQDLDRAVIVGRRSFGKGLVQQQFPFSDGSAVNLTVARYYTPSGRSIQKSYQDGVQNYHNEIAERMRKGELFSAESNLNDSIFKKTSNYRTISGKKVFSGGGIMPDIFVPADTTGNILLIQELSNRQLFTAYVIDRLEPLLNKFTSSGEFLSHYIVSDNAFNDFIQYASKTLKEMDSQEIASSKTEIKVIIKAAAARFKWGNNAYFEALNSNDATLKKAVEAVK